MNRRFLTYSLAAIIGCSALAYSQDSTTDRPQGQRQRPGQEQYQQREGQRGERPGMPNMPNREEMMKRMQNLREFSKKLEALKEYQFPDEAKNRDYHQKVEGLIKEYQTLIPQRPMMQGNEQGKQGKDGQGLKRPERSRMHDSSNTNRPPREARERAQPPAQE